MMTTTRETSEVLEDIPPDTNGAGPSEIHVNVEVSKISSPLFRLSSPLPQDPSKITGVGYPKC